MISMLGIKFNDEINYDCPALKTLYDHFFNSQHTFYDDSNYKELEERFNIKVRTSFNIECREVIVSLIREWINYGGEADHYKPPCENIIIFIKSDEFLYTLNDSYYREVYKISETSRSFVTPDNYRKLAKDYFKHSNIPTELMDRFCNMNDIYYSFVITYHDNITAFTSASAFLLLLREPILIISKKPTGFKTFRGIINSIRDFIMNGTISGKSYDDAPMDDLYEDDYESFIWIDAICNRSFLFWCVSYYNDLFKGYFRLKPIHYYIAPTEFNQARNETVLDSDGPLSLISHVYNLIGERLKGIRGVNKRKRILKQLGYPSMDLIDNFGRQLRTPIKSYEELFND